MKHKAFSFFLAFILLSVLPFSTAQAGETESGQQVRAGSSSDNSFYYELANMLSSSDNSSYFSEMELTIGSNVLTVDGEKKEMDTAPEVKDGSTMLPVRAIAETAGAEVSWDQSTMTATITGSEGSEISCTIGSDTIQVNGQSANLNTAPYVKDGRTYMPVRAVSEALNMDVEWNQETKTVSLTAPYQTSRLVVHSDSLNTSGLKANKVISDGNGMWVLQFASSEDARVADMTLKSRGMTSEPDLYIPPVAGAVSAESELQEGSHYSWGAYDAGFDSFKEKYSANFSGSEVVAVVDSGVDSSHPFLSGRVIDGYDFIDGDFAPYDSNSHGTHVAGTIVDCVGNAPVKILSVRVLGNDGSGTSLTVSAGIKYAADSGADVINLSVGGGHSYSEDEAVSYAIGKGCVIVTASGNDGTDTAYTCPAHITTPGTIVSAACDSEHNRAYFSNYGTSVDLTAPGVNINASIPGGGYSTYSGTSMAAPHVSAAAALIDLAAGKSLSPAEIENMVRSSTTYGTWIDQTIGCGFLDLTKANIGESPDTGSLDPVKPDPAEPDPATPDPAEPDPATPDPAEPDPVAPDPAKPDPIKPDPVKPDPAEPDPAVPDTDKPDNKPPLPDDDLWNDDGWYDYGDDWWYDDYDDEWWWYDEDYGSWYWYDGEYGDWYWYDSEYGDWYWYDSEEGQWYWLGSDDDLWYDDYDDWWYDGDYDYLLY